MSGIVHLEGRGDADLAIGSSGQITVIVPRPPMVTDLTFVSLESVSCRRSPASLPARRGKDPPPLVRSRLSG